MNPTKNIICTSLPYIKSINFRSLNKIGPDEIYGGKENAMNRQTDEQTNRLFYSFGEYKFDRVRIPLLKSNVKQKFEV